MSPFFIQRAAEQKRAICAAPRDFFEEVLNEFPKCGISVAFAYGSGVFGQTGQDPAAVYICEFFNMTFLYG